MGPGIYAEVSLEIDRRPDALTEFFETPRCARHIRGIERPVVTSGIWG
jgi:hypothetical protein